MVNRVNQLRKRRGARARAARGATWSEFERRRAASLGHLLLKAARLWNERALARVRAAGARGLRAAHTQLFPHLGPEGVRLTELAARLGVSKPAVGKLVAEMEARGAVLVEPDPVDGRAKRVRLSAMGQRAFLHGIGVMAELEAELVAELGADEVARLRAALGRVVSALSGERA
jgi:DNA-binding MarR family transcriptional regulator